MGKNPKEVLNSANLDISNEYGTPNVFAPGGEQRGNLADFVGWREEGGKKRLGCQKCPLKKVLLKGSSARKKKKGEESKANILLTSVKASLSCILFSRVCSHSPNRNGAQRRLSGTFVSCAQGQLGGCRLPVHTRAALK